jgi:hypothetical protein
MAPRNHGQAPTYRRSQALGSITSSKLRARLDRCVDSRTVSTQLTVCTDSHQLWCSKYCCSRATRGGGLAWFGWRVDRSRRGSTKHLLVGGLCLRQKTSTGRLGGTHAWLFGGVAGWVGWQMVAAVLDEGCGPRLRLGSRAEWVGRWVGVGERLDRKIRGC